MERAATAEGRSNLSLLKDLGTAYHRVGLIPEAKAWYKLALAQDPIDRDVQVALYNLGVETARARIKSIPESLSEGDARVSAVRSGESFRLAPRRAKAD